MQSGKALSLLDFTCRAKGRGQKPFSMPHYHNSAMNASVHYWFRHAYASSACCDHQSSGAADRKVSCESAVIAQMVK